ncbi:MAG TPA: flagellar biosynthesis anti-sigma factor FlgM, partial [Ramlibacter sp.]|nr:flagellar biosynthesis anti-sigma factor FlgM [Ramlibacter sp.]
MLKIDQTTGSATPLPLPAKTRTAAGRAASDSRQAKAQPAGAAPSEPDAANAAYRPEKVAAVREAIRQGRYQIDPERIADGLIGSVRELLQH